jgi:hypothetical protein
MRRTNARHYRHLREAIQLGSGAAHEGLSEERLKARVEEWYGKITFLPKVTKEELLIAAEAAFRGQLKSR